jgi:hypothetical protein
MKIHGDGGGFLLKSFTAAISAADQERNGPLDATAAAKIGIMRRTRSWRWSGSVHPLTLGIWALIHIPLIYEWEGVRGGDGIDEFFPDLFFSQPGPEYQAEEQGCQGSSYSDPKKVRHSDGVGRPKETRLEGVEG